MFFQSATFKGPLTCAVSLAFIAAGHAQPLPRPMPACTSPGQIIGLTLNTGTGLLSPPPGRFDPIWRIVPTADIFSTTRVSSWVPAPPGSRWVQRSIVGNPVSFPPAPWFNPVVYITRFTAQPANYQSITINGFYSGDNTANFKLNGIPIGSCFSGTCFTALHPITPPNSSQFGPLNVVTVEVTNASFSPSALLVRAAVTAKCL
jgi:hypothetical protein